MWIEITPQCRGRVDVAVADPHLDVAVAEIAQRRLGPAAEVAVDLDRQNRQTGFQQTVCQGSGAGPDLQDPVACLQLRSIDDAIQHMLIT